MIVTSGVSKTMYEHPSFTNYKKMVKTHVKPAGNMVTLKCKAHGIPTPNITWYKNNEKPKRHLGIIRYGPWYLSLEDLVTDDSGIYTCVVCNIVGCISYNFTVDVVGKNHFIIFWVFIKNCSLNFILHLSKQKDFRQNLTLKMDTHKM